MRTSILLLAFVVVWGCGSGPSADTRPSEEPAAPPSDARRPALGADPVIVAFGDSLTAGYGVPLGQSYPDYLRRGLDRLGFSYVVRNEGMSGDTTNGGLVRKEIVSALNPEYVIVAFGGNDGLRGLDPERMKSNLREMINHFRQRGSQVVLAGMKLPPNYGREYLDAFEKVFPEIAEDLDVPLIPFLLEGVGGNPELMQADGLHPTAEGNRLVARNVLQVLEPLLAAHAEAGQAR